ncbi:MAG: hypothetical protein ABWY13_17545 [Mesorhizobium sp.]
MAFNLLAAVVNAPHRREVKVPHRDIRVLILLHRLSQGVDLSLIGLLGIGRACNAQAQETGKSYSDAVGETCRFHRDFPNRVFLRRPFIGLSDC